MLFFLKTDLNLLINGASTNIDLSMVSSVFFLVNGDDWFLERDDCT